MCAHPDDPEGHLCDIEKCLILWKLSRVR